MVESSTGGKPRGRDWVPGPLWDPSLAPRWSQKLRVVPPYLGFLCGAMKESSAGNEIWIPKQLCGETLGKSLIPALGPSILICQMKLSNKPS